MMSIGSLMILQVLNKNTIKLRCSLINSSEKKLPLELIFDTGATTTTIRRDFLILLGYNELTKAKQKTRTGKGFVYLDQCKIAKLKIENINLDTSRIINVFDPHPDDLDFHGVIGMDIISVLETLISREKNVVNIASMQENLEIVKKHKDEIKNCESRIRKLEIELSRYKPASLNVQ